MPLQADMLHSEEQQMSHFSVQSQNNLVEHNPQFHSSSYVSEANELPSSGNYLSYAQATDQ